jgi:hypothetical protein
MTMAETARAALRDLPIGARFRYTDRHREGDGSGFDDVSGKTTEPFVAVKTWGKHRQRYLAGGETGPLLDWPGDRHGLWHHLTPVEVMETPPTAGKQCTRSAAGCILGLPSEICACGVCPECQPSTENGNG